jgi:hypothetical protein
MFRYDFLKGKRPPCNDQYGFITYRTTIRAAFRQVTSRYGRYLNDTQRDR